jgi:hypothetical protein
MTPYAHTQRATLLVVMMMAASAIFIVIGFAVCRPVLLAAPGLIAVGWLFHSLTIEIGDDELRWRFGPGLMGKRTPLNEIVSAQVVRTNVLEGWGVHYSRYGWLYNVSGFDAVAITLRDGKRFCLGTDEPEKLSAALLAQMV